MKQQLCRIRELYHSIAEFETRFETEHDLCLNEAMILCLLSEGEYSSGAIAEQMGLTCSNTSKVIRSVEQKGLIKRVLGDRDKRQMFFRLADEGKKRLAAVDCHSVKLPPMLEAVLG